MLETNIATLVGEIHDVPITRRHVSTILSMNGIAPKFQNGRTSEIRDTVLQTAKDHPTLSDHKIAELVQKKLHRNVSYSHVGTILRKNGIPSPFIKRKEELRDTVLTIAKENPHLSARKINNLVWLKLNRKVADVTVSQIIQRHKNGRPARIGFSNGRSTELRDTILQMAKENPDLPDRQLTFLIRKKAEQRSFLFPCREYSSKKRNSRQWRLRS